MQVRSQDIAICFSTWSQICCSKQLMCLEKWAKAPENKSIPSACGKKERIRANNTSPGSELHPHFHILLSSAIISARLKLIPRSSSLYSIDFVCVSAVNERIRLKVFIYKSNKRRAKWLELYCRAVNQKQIYSNKAYTDASRSTWISVSGNTGPVSHSVQANYTCARILTR